MLITFKTISQETFQLNFEPNTTISEIKTKIAEEKGNDRFAFDAQKLIYNGKILADNETVEELKIEEKKFIVVMVTKKKTTATSSNDANTSAAIEEKKVEPTTLPAVEKDLNFPPEHEKMVDTIQSMGYPREEVVRALKAAFFNADRAVEYLCNGIPEGMENLIENPQDRDVNSEDGDNVLQFLANHPQFQQVLELIRSNPDKLPQVIQEIAVSNPEIMSAIRRDPEQFTRMINNETSNVSLVPPTNEPSGTNDNSRTVTISLTENDRSAIERLKALGFPEQIILEAYFACDKNEDLAVNYILTRMDEFNNEQNN